MKNRIYILCIVIGITILLLPYLLNIINQINKTYVINKYSEKVEQMDEESIKDKKKEYEEYNKAIQNNDTVNIFKQGEMLGYIKIKKINIFLPIYEGTKDKTLLKGIGHLEQTSLPTTRGTYNAVFVGHNGISMKKYFDNLEFLKIGDRFNITILNEQFHYKVIDKYTILPNKTEKLNVIKNKKIVCLVTCIPKYINSHRLVVVGENYTADF